MPRPRHSCRWRRSESDLAVDLHLHSTCSDGTDDPVTVVRLAADAGLTALALTDHDNLDGIEEARTAADDAGLRLIPGTELSVDWETGTMHLLVYFLEPGDGRLQDRLVELRAARAMRNHQILEQLAEHGIHIDHEEVQSEAGGEVIGRPHIASVLIQHGHVASIAEAFDMWLAKGRPGYVDRYRLSAIEAIALARDSGALPVIAHPHTAGLAADDFATAFRTLTDRGLAGIEAYYAEYDRDLREHLVATCERLGIVATGGSDYHGRYKPGLSVGSGRGDLHVPDEVVEHLDRARSS